MNGLHHGRKHIILGERGINILKKLFWLFFIFIKSLYDITPVNVSFKFRCIVAIFVLTHHQDMEDAHTQLLSLPGDKDAMFFGVFDGHGGT